MSTPPDDDDLDRLVEGWLDGVLDEAEARALGARLAADPAAADRFARATLLHDRLRDLLRAGEGTIGPAPARRPAWRGGWLALPAAVLAVALAVLFLARVPEATAEASLERVVRASAVGDREYVVHVLDHGPGGAVVVDSEAGGRKPGVDGARLWVHGSDRFVLRRTFRDGSHFVNGSDGSIGWSVPPTGHVHLSRDVGRFRRGIPGEGADIPFIALPENLLRLGRGYDLRLGPPAADGTRELVAARRGSRRRGPSRVTIRFGADGTPLSIEMVGLREGLEWVDPAGDAADGPDRVALELVSRAPLEPGFYGHEHHHGPDRPLNWE